MFYQKELQKTYQEEFRIEKVIKGKDVELYVIWKSYDNLFNSWIDKKQKLNTVPVDLSKLTNVVNNEVVKKTVYSKLVTKVNIIDTSGCLKN